MKKDRNCGGATPYPVYPNYTGMPMGGPMQSYNVAMPIPGPMPAPMPMGNMQNYTTTTYSNNDEINRMKEQIQNLDRRVSRLESMVNNKSTSFGSNAYTDANYHIM